MEDVVFLVVVPDFYFASQGETSSVSGEDLVDDFQQSGFACPVISDNRHPLAALDFKIQAGKQMVFAKTFGKSFYREYVISADGARLQFDTDFIVDFNGLFQDFNLFQHFFPAFCPFNRLFPVEGLELCDDFLLMFDFLLLVHPGFQRIIPELFFLFSICGVVA